MFPVKSLADFASSHWQTEALQSSHHFSSCCGSTSMFAANLCAALKRLAFPRMKRRGIGVKGRYNLSGGKKKKGEDGTVEKSREVERGAT